MNRRGLDPMPSPIAAVIIGLAALIALSAIALQWAIARNGPAVLDAIDRIATSANFNGAAKAKASADAGAVQPTGAHATRRLGPFAYGPHPAQRLFVHLPAAPGHAKSTTEARPQPHQGSWAGQGSPSPVVIFFHGGSWRTGDPEDYDFIGRALAPFGIVTVNAGYRLGDDGRYPAMLEDGAAALGWVHGHIASLGGDRSRIYLMGHSAGAYNAVQLALDRRWLEAEGLSPDAIAGVIGLAGPYDFHPFDSDSTRAIFGQAQDPLDTQPVRHVRADAPPMLLVHGEADSVVRPRNSRALAARLKAAGASVELATYPGWSHNDPLLALASPWRERRDTVERIADFILSRANEPQAAAHPPVQGPAGTASVAVKGARP